jgi:hypothetical protein
VPRPATVAAPRTAHAACAHAPRAGRAQPHETETAEKENVSGLSALSKGKEQNRVSNRSAWNACEGDARQRVDCWPTSLKNTQRSASIAQVLVRVRVEPTEPHRQQCKPSGAQLWRQFLNSVPWQRPIEETAQENRNPSKESGSEDDCHVQAVRHRITRPSCIQQQSAMGEPGLRQHHQCY